MNDDDYIDEEYYDIDYSDSCDPFRPNGDSVELYDREIDKKLLNN